MKKRNRDILLIDGMNLAYRAFYKFKKFSNTKGYPTGMFYGFLKSLLSLKENYNTNKIIILWEGKNNWRNDYFPEYRKNRHTNDKEKIKEKSMILDLLVDLRQVLYCLGIFQLSLDKAEADDLCYYFSKLIFKENVKIVTNDKDMLQLVDDKNKIRVLKPINNFNGKGIISHKNYQIMNEKEVKKKFGVLPKELPLLLALSGDSVDGIPGIKGMGQKTALKFIEGMNKNKASFEDYCKYYFEGKDYTEIYKVIMRNLLLINFQFSLQAIFVPYTCINKYNNKISFLDDSKINEFKNYDFEFKNLYLQNVTYTQYIRNVLKEFEIKSINILELKSLVNKDFNRQIVRKIIFFRRQILKNKLQEVI